MTPSARRHVLSPCIAALLLAVGIPALARPAQQPSAPPVTPIRASALEIRQIHSDDVKLPAEFQMSMYENVVDQVDKTKRFEHVYRDGDRDAAAAPELVTLNCTVTGFKKGSAEARQVTTVAGATSITVHLVFTDKNGKTLFENDVKGQVRLFGENLRATYDFGKKTAAVVRTDFLPTTPEHK